MKNVRLICRKAGGEERKVLVSAPDFQTVLVVASERLGTDSVLLQIKDSDGGAGSDDAFWEVDQSYWPSLNNGQTIYAEPTLKRKASSSRLPSAGAARRKGRTTDDEGTSGGEDTAAPSQRRRSGESVDGPQKKRSRESQGASSIGGNHSNVALPRSSNVGPQRSPASKAKTSPQKRSVDSPAKKGKKSQNSQTIPGQHSSRKKWTPSDDAFLWQWFKKELNKIQVMPTTSVERHQLFTPLSNTPKLSGRTNVALYTRVRAKISSAVSNGEKVPDKILEFFGMLRVMRSTSRPSAESSGSRSGGAAVGEGRDRQGHFGQRRPINSDPTQASASTPRTKTYVVVDEDDEHGDQESGSSSSGEDESSEEADEDHAREVSVALPAPRGLPRPQTSRLDVAMHQARQHYDPTEEPRAAATYDTLVIDDNVRSLRQQQAALNPFAARPAPPQQETPLPDANATAIREQDNRIHPSRRERVKTEEASEDELMDSDQQNIQNAPGSFTEPYISDLAFRLEPIDAVSSSSPRDEGYAVTPNAHPDDVALLRMAMSPAQAKLRAEARRLVVETCKRCRRPINDIQDLPYGPARSFLTRLICSHFTPATSENRTAACADIACGIASALFEDVAPPEWSVRRTSFALAGYCVKLSVDDSFPNLAPPARVNAAPLLTHFVTTAERTFWALGAAQQVVSPKAALDSSSSSSSTPATLHGESEDICAALALTRNHRSGLRAMLDEHASTVRTAAQVQGLLQRMDRLSSKMEASVAFLKRCDVPLRWGATMSVAPQGDVPDARTLEAFASKWGVLR